MLKPSRKAEGCTALSTTPWTPSMSPGKPILAHDIMALSLAFAI